MFPACIRCGSNKQDCPSHTLEQSCQTQELRQNGRVAFAPSFLSLYVALDIPVESVGTGALRVYKQGPKESEPGSCLDQSDSMAYHCGNRVPEQESEAQVIFFSGLFLRRTASQPRRPPPLCFSHMDPCFLSLLELRTIFRKQHMKQFLN